MEDFKDDLPRPLTTSNLLGEPSIIYSMVKVSAHYGAVKAALEESPLPNPLASWIVWSQVCRWQHKEERGLLRFEVATLAKTGKGIWKEFYSCIPCQLGGAVSLTRRQIYCNSSD